MPPVLTPHKRRKAVSYNERKARTIGWIDRWRAVCTELNISDPRITAEEFAETVAVWQENNELKPGDGMFGKNTWRRMKRKTLNDTGTMMPPHWLPKAPKLSPVEPLTFVPGDTPWMEIARREMMNNWRNGDVIIGEDDVHIDEGYWAATPYWGGKFKAAGTRPGKHSPDWCAAFVNYCLHTAGYSHTGSAGALSFARREWRFKALSKPERGCVIVVQKGGAEHVAFLDDPGNLPEDPKGDVNGKKVKGPIMLFGGNQTSWLTGTGHATTKHADDREKGVGTINTANFGTWTLLAGTDAKNNKSPYMMPLREGSNCNCSIPTAHPHDCWGHWK